MTWSEFKTDVKTLLTVDANRLGATDFTNRFILAGTESVLSHVPFYRTVNTTRYNNTAPIGIKPLTTEGNASAGVLPEQANVIQAWVITDADGDPSVTDSSDSECVRYPLISYSYSNRQDLICDTPVMERSQGYMAIGKAGDFFVYPRLIDSEILELTWEGERANHQDTDKVPYDSPVAECVAEYVKAHVKREVDHDLKLYESYLASFRRKRRDLYLNTRSRTHIRKQDGTGRIFTSVCTETEVETSNC